jgi:hypothetical protein
VQAAAIYSGPEFKALAVRYPRLRYVYEHYHTRALLVVPIWQRPDGGRYSRFPPPGLMPSGPGTWPRWED